MTHLPFDLSNWRQPPQNRDSFSRVETLLPVDEIPAGPAVAPLPQGEALDLSRIMVPTPAGPCPVPQLLADTFTDGFLVLHKGRVVAEHAPNLAATARHILFSVSKSVTGSLAGILVGEGKLDPDALVTRYVPEVAASAYRDCPVRHVLDMTVDLDFVEDYVDLEGDYARYRIATAWNPPRPGFGEVGLHKFLATVRPGRSNHGWKFDYKSVSSDLLGWIVERAAGTTLARVMAERLWQPVGAETAAYITTDGMGGARTAGGMGMTLRDIARFAEVMRNEGKGFDGRQIIPAAWVKDIREGGSRDAWARGAMTHLFPQGSYRAKWYKANDADGSFCAIGIHGQWIYVNPARELSIVKFSSQPDAVVDAMEVNQIALFTAVSRVLT
ncbi:MAG: serine hydrolase [Hyphomicrobiales bacterium]